MTSQTGSVTVDDARQAILDALINGLNVIGNAGHIKDLAAAYALLTDENSKTNLNAGMPRKANTPYIAQ